MFEIVFGLLIGGFVAFELIRRQIVTYTYQDEMHSISIVFPKLDVMGKIKKLNDILFTHKKEGTDK